MSTILWATEHPIHVHIYYMHTYYTAVRITIRSRYNTVSLLQHCHTRENKVQSGAVITRFNELWYSTMFYSDWYRTKIRVCIHERHPISRPHGWAMGCLLWEFWRNLTTLQRHRTVLVTFSKCKIWSVFHVAFVKYHALLSFIWPCIYVFNHRFLHTINKNYQLNFYLYETIYVICNELNDRGHIDMYKNQQFNKITLSHVLWYI